VYDGVREGCGNRFQDQWRYEDMHSDRREYSVCVFRLRTNVIQHFSLELQLVFF
jgi:hypothetical protein